MKGFPGYGIFEEKFLRIRDILGRNYRDTGYVKLYIGISSDEALLFFTKNIFLFFTVFASFFLACLRALVFVYCLREQ